MCTRGLPVAGANRVLTKSGGASRVRALPICGRVTAPSTRVVKGLLDAPDGRPVQAMKHLRVEIGSAAGAVVIAPAGELDLAGAPILERAVQEAAHSGSSPLVLDLKDLTFIDAAGLRALMRADEALGGRLVVRSPGPDVLRVLIIAGADQRLCLEPRRSPTGSADLAASNVAYVKRVCAAFEARGAAALVGQVPEDVIWRPASGNGQILLGLQEFIRFWATRDPPPIFARELEAVGEDVLVHREPLEPDGTVNPLWSLFRFHGPRLIEVISSEHPPAVLERAA